MAPGDLVRAVIILRNAKEIVGVIEAYAKLRLLLVRGSMPEVFSNLATRRIR
jgi:hypothetical protein